MLIDPGGRLPVLTDDDLHIPVQLQKWQRGGEAHGPLVEPTLAAKGPVHAGHAQLGRLRGPLAGLDELDDGGRGAGRQERKRDGGGHAPGHAVTRTIRPPTVLGPPGSSSVHRTSVPMGHDSPLASWMPTAR